jgi:small ligand-binding sensory domain FIST
MTSSTATASTMQWASTLSSLSSLYQALDACVSQVQTQLEGRRVDLVIAFISPGFSGNFQWVAPFLAERLPTSLFLGCTGGSLFNVSGGEQTATGTFLIRTLMGISLEGVLAVGARLRPGQMIQFHIRDGRTSSEDIHLMLSRYHSENGQQARGALLFSCLGRGEQLYGVPDHDLNCIQRYLGPIPVGGFFCNGEIGPVGSETYLHGFTSVVGLFRPKSDADDL